jgi:hypothetical protein
MTVGRRPLPVTAADLRGLTVLNAPVDALTTRRPLTDPTSVRPLEAPLAGLTPDRNPTKVPRLHDVHRLPVGVMTRASR